MIGTCISRSIFSLLARISHNIYIKRNYFAISEIPLFLYKSDFIRSILFSLNYSIDRIDWKS